MDRKSKSPEDVSELRRVFLKTAGGSAALASLGAMAACSGGEDTARRPTNEVGQAEDAEEPITDAADAAVERVAEEVDSAADAETADGSAEAPNNAAADAAAQMPRLDPSDPQAQSLAYVDDASSLDPDQQPRFQAGQACNNCALYVGNEGSEWGPCSIFPGRLVNAAGWCSVYAPKA